jgi:hypothetical protein
LAAGIGRVLINAQIAAGSAFTLRLRHDDEFFAQRLRLWHSLSRNHYGTSQRVV